MQVRCRRVKITGVSQPVAHVRSVHRALSHIWSSSSARASSISAAVPRVFPRSYFQTGYYTIYLPCFLSAASFLSAAANHARQDGTVNARNPTPLVRQLAVQGAAPCRLIPPTRTLLIPEFTTTHDTTGILCTHLSSASFAMRRTKPCTLIPPSRTSCGSGSPPPSRASAPSPPSPSESDEP